MMMRTICLLVNTTIKLSNVYVQESFALRVRVSLFHYKPSLMISKKKATLRWKTTVILQVRPSQFPKLKKNFVSYIGGRSSRDFVWREREIFFPPNDAEKSNFLTETH